jgi:hypothetical protein
VPENLRLEDLVMLLMSCQWIPLWRRLSSLEQHGLSFFVRDSQAWLSSGGFEWLRVDAPDWLTSRRLLTASNAREALAESVRLFKPDTPIGRHRAIVRRKWTFK